MEGDPKQLVARLKGLLAERSYDEEPSVAVIEPEIRSPAQYAMRGSIRRAILNTDHEE
jgi:hypothetical protein